MQRFFEASSGAASGDGRASVKKSRGAESAFRPLALSAVPATSPPSERDEVKEKTLRALGRLEDFLTDAQSFAKAQTAALNQAIHRGTVSAAELMASTDASTRLKSAIELCVKVVEAKKQRAEKRRQKNAEKRRRRAA